MLCIFIFPCVYPSIYIKILSQSLTYTHITHTHTHTYLTHSHTHHSPSHTHIPHSYTSHTHTPHTLTHTHITHHHTHTYLTHTHHTPTHLLRTVIANSDVECILRAKNTPIKPDRKGSMTRSEKDWNVTYPSEPNRSPSIDSWEIQIAKTVQTLRWHGMKTERLGLVLT